MRVIIVQMPKTTGAFSFRGFDTDLQVRLALEPATGSQKTFTFVGTEYRAAWNLLDCKLALVSLVKPNRKKNFGKFYNHQIGAPPRNPSPKQPSLHAPRRTRPLPCPRPRSGGQKHASNTWDVWIFDNPTMPNLISDGDLQMYKDATASPRPKSVQKWAVYDRCLRGRFSMFQRGVVAWGHFLFALSLPIPGHVFSCRAWCDQAREHCISWPPLMRATATMLG